MYDVLGVLNFLYLPQIPQYKSFMIFVIEKLVVLFSHSSNNHEKKKKLYNLANFYLLT